MAVVDVRPADRRPDRNGAMIDDPRLPPRFWAKVSPEPNTGCWLWLASLNNGYGQLGIGRHGMIRAFRLAYEKLVGPVPEGLELDHVIARGCVGKLCCNPLHLEPITHRENTLRGVGPTARNAAKTHCPAGHPYAGDNLHRTARGRFCRACQRARNARRRRIR